MTKTNIKKLLFDSHINEGRYKKKLRKTFKHKSLWSNHINEIKLIRGKILPKRRTGKRIQL